MRVFRLVLAVVILLSATASFAAQDHIRGLFPASGSNGWKLVSGSYAYGKEQGLTEIYDGGYKEYLDAGVVEAAKQTYQKKKIFADVIVHKMNSEAAAKAFYARQLKSAGKAAKVAPRPLTAFTWLTGGSVYGYLIRGDYYVTITLTSKDQASVLALMREVESKIKGRKPPSGKSR